MKKAIGFLDQHLEECLAGIALIVMTSLVFLQVVMRYVFQSPFSWSDEIAVYCLIGFIYLGAAWAIRDRSHIRVLNVLRGLSPRWRTPLIIVSELIWFLANGFIVYQSLLLNESMWQMHYESPVLRIDQKWPYLILPFAFTLMMVRQLQVYSQWLLHGRSPIEPDQPLDH